MKLFLRHILIFSILTIIGYSILILLWGAFSPTDRNLKYSLGNRSHAFLRFKEAKEKSNIDILFLGSSHSYHGFDTRIFKKNGFDAFHLSNSSQTPIQSEYLLEKYLDSLKPKTVIYEICPQCFSRNGIESTVEILSNQKMDIGAVKMAWKYNNFIVNNSMLYSFLRNLLFSDLKKYTPKKKIGNNTYVNGGYVHTDLVGNKDLNKKFERRTWTIHQKNNKAFVRIIKKLKNQGIDLLLIQVPKTSSFYNSFTNNNEFNQYVSEYGAFYDFNKFLPMNDSIHFFDNDHLNQHGVEIFNKSLVEKILKN